MAKGSSEIRGLSRGADVQSTQSVLESLGSEFIQSDDGAVYVSGWGDRGPRESHSVLDCGNSGTTLRLLSGLLSASPGLHVLTGDASLSARPQGRILRPLKQMGATVLARGGGKFAPVVVQGGQLNSFKGSPEVASAQVKSCLLLAGLASGVEVELRELGRTRDHTERMLMSLEVPIDCQGLDVKLPEGRWTWDGFRFEVPGDPSSAAFLVASAIVAERSRIVIEGVCLNPTRIGFFEIIRRMGANLQMEVTGERMGEPVGRITASSSRLIGTVVEPHEVPTAIDEFPLLATLATAAEGHTVVSGAEELRVKESDRIRTVVTELSKMGARITEAPDGFTVYGPTPLTGASVECHHDHRLEMSLAIAGSMAEGETHLLNSGWAAVSFPEFWEFFPGRMERFQD